MTRVLGSGACPMCKGTDAERECAAGKCQFQEQIEAEAEESRRVNDALAPGPPL
jgi:hypothetical protein